MHAPSELVYAIRSEFLSFVGLAGADANLLDFNLGSNLAQFPSIVFKVLIDGREAAVSPVMRFDTLAWRFDVQIPVGARRLSLVAMNGGNGSRENFADWADAGFTLRS